MTVKLVSGGMIAGAIGSHEAVEKIAQYIARDRVSQVTDLTDNSGGSVSSDRVVAGVQTAFTNEANSGGDLAGSTSTQSALDTVTQGINELIAQANEVGADLGFSQMTNNLVESADDTIASITVSVTGASTGVQATQLEALRESINDAIYNAAAMVNWVAYATGEAELDIQYAGVLTDTQADIDHTATGSAADPGVKKSAMDSALAQWRDDIATIAARLNACTGTLPAVPIVAQRG